MKLFIATVVAICALSANATERDREAFPGKYKLTVQTWWGSAEVAEFLLNSKGEMKVVENNIDNEIQDLGFHYLHSANSFGPELPVGVITAGLGSDEDGLSAHVYIAWVGESGDEELKLVTQFVTYMDGPNNVGDYYTDFITLEIWDKSKKKYVELKAH